MAAQAKLHGNNDYYGACVQLTLYAFVKIIKLTFVNPDIFHYSYVVVSFNAEHCMFFDTVNSQIAKVLYSVLYTQNTIQAHCMCVSEIVTHLLAVSTVQCHKPPIILGMC